MSSDVVSFFRHPKNHQAVFELHNVHVKQGQHVVLHDLSVSVARGKITAICGTNGCGKSTLLNVLSGLMSPISGDVKFAGKSLTAYDRQSLAKQLTLLAQFNHAPNHMTIRELLSLGRYAHRPSRFDMMFNRRVVKQAYEADQQAINEALQLTDLTLLAEHELATLSGGQRQRAWIALALAQSTEVILLDEPTTYLDIFHQAELLTMLQQLNRQYGKTIVWVLHDLNQAALFSDEIILLQKGRLVAKDTPKTLMQQDKFSEVFGMPMDYVVQSSIGQTVCLPSYHRESGSLPSSMTQHH